MLGGISRTKFAPAAKSCPFIFTRSTGVKSDAVPRKCFHVAARNLSSKPKVPLISTRQFRSNASGRAAVTDLPMFHDGPVPAPYEPPNTAKVPGLPVYDASLTDRAAYWQKIPRWANVTEAQFLKYKFHVSISARWLCRSC